MAPLSFRRDKTPVPEASANSYAAESSASPGRPFRFLRRKTSMSARQHSDSDASSLMPNTASTTASFGDPLETLPADVGVYRPVRRGSEPNVGPIASVAAAGVGDAGVEASRRNGPWADTDGVVVIPSRIPDLPRPSKIGSEHPFLSNMASDGSLGRPTSPPTAVDLTPAPIYPTALSPPRRPMPKSRPADVPPLSLDSPIPGLGPSPRPAITAEWLSRKPSGRRRSNGTPGQAGARGGSEGSPQPRLRAAAPITPTSGRSRGPSSSTTASASTSAAESDDGEIGIVSSKRRSHRDVTGLYEVEVVCNDTRDDNNEMRWEVVVRKRKPEGSQATAPTSPLPVSTSSSVAPAPSSASSINLSLSLDNPTGKLVFIAFPMDIHATPRRKPRSTAPSTPPRPVTPPPAPNPNLSTPPSLGHRKGVSESSMYPSPSRAGRRSPSQPSPRNSEIWTPRRTRMVSASDLNGGLYARGTVDGMSEELEQIDVNDRPRSDEEERAARVARWNHDKI